MTDTGSVVDGRLQRANRQMLSLRIKPETQGYGAGSADLDQRLQSRARSMPSVSAAAWHASWMEGWPSRGLRVP